MFIGIMQLMIPYQFHIRLQNKNFKPWIYYYKLKCALKNTLPYKKLNILTSEYEFIMKLMNSFPAILLALMIVSCSPKATVVAQTPSSSTEAIVQSGNSSVRYGSSIENAVIVASIDEEYAFARKHCSGCKLKGQSLVSQGKLHYDLLTFETSTGEIKKYYFDINSFYGKF